MTEGPQAAMQLDEAEKVYSKYWKKLKEVIARNPKGRAYDEQGQFYPDPVPIAPPIGYVQEPSMFDRVRDMIRKEASLRAQAEGFETFEESDDFEVEDDYEPFSPYELHFVEQAVPDGPIVRPEEPESAPSSAASSSERRPNTPSGSEAGLDPAGNDATVSSGRPGGLVERKPFKA